MAKSKKKRRPAKREKDYPPLSKADKFLYAALEIVGFIFVFAFLYGHEHIIGLFVFRNTDILSFQVRLTLFLMVPFILFYLFSIIDPQATKKPVFGNKKVDYYNTLNHKFILPLFDKRYKNISRYSENRKKQLKKIIILCCISIILFTVGVLGCIGRYEFSRDGITAYSIFNNVTEEYTYDEVESYSVEAYYHHTFRPRGLSYTDSDINLTVRFANGENFTVSYDGSRDVYALEEIDKILKNKNKTVDSDYLQKFISRHDLTDDELKVI